MSYEITIHDKLDDIPANEWNALVRDNHPFMRHEFLAAMEHHGCVGETFGWLPCHVAVRESGELVAAMPLYRKTNSYGEFVFDHAWADAWRRAGLDYYPKLVSAVPYTPATGQRLLCREGEDARWWPALIETGRRLARETGASGFHCLFAEPAEQDFMEGQMLARHDCQFHWRNRDYVDFEDFLARLRAKKRKNIRQERRRVRQAGIRFRVLDGDTASERDWADFAHFYDRLFDEKWGMATFNQGFFMAVARALPDQVVLVMADRDERCIAGALMYRSDHVLYGRHWGCIEQVEHLHFETCYYQGIEYCIRHGLKRFEPGAQGEHKIARGFLPTMTRSAHWLCDNPFQRSIEAFVEHERAAIDGYIEDASRLSPYRQEQDSL